ncbi:MAG: 30S ribosomal protein S8 [Candidatus Levybacteria bacterium]|nr:30S ribosomal protein S8 [Candidatus Levybacteria bacterium]
MNYQVADTIIRIKNAAAAKRRKTFLPYSRMNKAIATILVKEQFLSGLTEEEQDGRKVLVAAIAYNKRVPMMTDVSIVSKPSLRVYTKAKNLAKRARNGAGVTVVSTSQGIMTEEQAAKKEIGGEMLFRIW